MKLSDAGLYALALHEGIVPGPYRDSVGVWTYGIGHTAAAGGLDPADMPRGMPANLSEAVEDAIDMFRHDAAKYEAAVARAVKVPLKQHQFDALVSFHYNTGAIAKASLVKKLNAGDYEGAGAGLMAWVKPPEVRKRREAERDLFLRGVYPGGTVNVWGVTKEGKVIWKPVMRLNMPQFLAIADAPPVFADPGHTPKPVVTSPAPNPAAKGFWASLVTALMGILKGR